MINGNGDKGLMAIIFVLCSVIGTMGLVCYYCFRIITYSNHSNKQIIQSTNQHQDNTITESSTYNQNNQKSTVTKKQILSYYKERIAMNNDNYHHYSIADINNDDIPELFIYVSGMVGNQIIADTSIYTYDENKGNQNSHYIVEIGSVNGKVGDNTILYTMNDGRLLVVYGHMGYESTTYFKLEDDWLIRTEFSSRETENYIKGDKEIKFVDCSDTSLIDKFN